jgi:endonuclease/exonuclease/phosphatase (EEP) superfamily protein YafD
MSWTTFQILIRQFSTPTRRLISIYAIGVALLTLIRLLGIIGVWWIDLANAFAPYWYMPMVVTFPLLVIVTRQVGKNRPPRWSVMVQIVLMVIGLVWFALPTIYKPITPPEGETFKVVTYNVQGANTELDEATAWLIASNADIIVLEETSDGYDQRLEALYDVYAHEEHIEGSVRIFSHYEILSKELLIIEQSPGHLVLRLVLSQQGHELAVYATHFALPRTSAKHLFVPTPNYGLDFALHYDETRRNTMIHTLLDILREETLPYILAGDFNTSDASLIYHEIEALMVDAFREAGAGAGRTWPVADAIGLPPVISPFLRIDYIWHSSHMRAVEASVGSVPIGSDHLPVTAILEWIDNQE